MTTELCQTCCTPLSVFLQLTDKLLLAQRMEADHERLQAEHQLLLKCCEGLQLLRLQHSEMDGSFSASDEELALLQQLQVCLAWLFTTDHHAASVSSRLSVDCYLLLR
jgi:hypothetical protein